MAIESLKFQPNTNLVMACFITGVHDVNRNTTLSDDSAELVQDWAASVTAANLKGIIFHNNLSESTCKSLQNNSISFIKIDSFFNSLKFKFSILSITGLFKKD